MKSRERRSKSTCRCLVLLPVAYESIVLYCIVLYSFEAAPPAAAECLSSGTGGASSAEFQTDVSARF